MGNIRFNLLIGIRFFFLLALFEVCGGGDAPFSDEEEGGKHREQGQNTVPSVMNLVAEKTEKAKELQVSWINSVGAIPIEISYMLKGGNSKSIVKKNIRIATGKNGSFLIVVSEPETYIVTAVAVDNYGRRSDELTVMATPLRGEEVVRTYFLRRADILTTSLMNLCFGKSACECWNTKYPHATRPYWNGDTVVWGQGAGFSGFVVLRKASSEESTYRKKYIDMTERMYNSVNRC